MSGQKQHVDAHRKSLLRKRLLGRALKGPAYVPFIGDGDLALAHYTGRTVWGADLDPARVNTATGRLPVDARVVVADCNTFPFPTGTGPFAVADFDAYNDPYPAFRSFWSQAPKLRKLVLFFTDGCRQAASRAGVLVHPDGTRKQLRTMSEKRAAYNFRWARIIRPWFDEFIEPYRVVTSMIYLRLHMVYWGAVIER